MKCPYCPWDKPGSWLTLAGHLHDEHAFGWVEATRIARGRPS